MSTPPTLWIIIPCFNEEAVLPITAPIFLEKLDDLIRKSKISTESKILFINDGSKDKTWDIICKLARINSRFVGISQSRNRGHQSSLLAGLMEAKDKCDVTISMDCDGQDDINVAENMIDAYSGGGVRLYTVLGQLVIAIHILRRQQHRVFINSCI